VRFDWNAIDREFDAILGDRGGVSLDRERIERFAADIAAGRIGPESARLGEDPEPPQPGDIDDWTAVPADEARRLADAGRAAIAAGQVAVVVLNGGMATRFGGAVKGVVEAVAGRSFLEIKLEQVRRQGPVPFLAMNSFATHAQTREFLASRGLEREVDTFLQFVSLRLTPEGDLFRDGAGRISPHAPGHGDFPEALRVSGLLERLERRGVRAILLSNVDNLGADLDPGLIGYHLGHRRALTVEVARPLAADVGGAPMRARGKLQVIEGFRFPRGFDLGRVPWVNTNTFTFSLAALRDPFPLTWFYVQKQVDGRSAVQMERLVGQVSAFVDTAYVGIPRAGERGRFLPVKTPADLEALRADPGLRRRFGPD
jgi:UTP--glucose-1-phosphate uridylyltransferase